MRRSEIFLLGQVIMKQHPKNITHKSPENQSCDSELQRNICFFTSQGTSMQKDKGSPRPWKEAIAGQVETTAPAVLIVEDCVPLCTGKSNPRKKRCLLDTVSVLGCCSFALQLTSGLYCKSCQPKVYSKPLAHFGQDVLDVLQKHLLN